MKDSLLPVRIGNFRLLVPEFHDKRTTQEIVGRLSDQLSIIEEESVRVDSVAFALLTAYHFACEAYELKNELKDQEKDFSEQIDTLMTKVRNAINVHESQKKSTRVVKD